MLKEKAVTLYLDQGKNCAEAIVAAANETYHMDLSEDALGLITGFGTGMGCKSTCGALAASISVLGKLYAQTMEKESFQALETEFVSAFQKRLGSLNCEQIAAVYKHEDERRCSEAVAIASELLEEFLSVKSSPKKLPEDEVKRLKGLGCLRDKRFPDVFNVRVITRNGKLTSEKHMAVAEAAKKFGSGEVTMTTRLTLEIQGVHYGDVDPLIHFLAERDLQTGGTGSKVRPVVSCKGTTCQYGLCDTFHLSERLHEQFYEGYHDITLPHKFKIAVGGCPNNCVKPDLNDIGIIGQKVPAFQTEKCRGCKVCVVEKSCPVQAAAMSDGVIGIRETDCNNCGRCAKKCPFGVTDKYTTAYKICLGGRWGKKTAHGRPMSKLLYNEQDVVDMVENAILFYRAEGKTGERFADTIARLGMEYTEKKLYSDELLRDKKHNLQKTVKGGATC